MRKINLDGMRFGRWFVIGQSKDVQSHYFKQAAGGYRHWVVNGENDRVDILKQMRIEAT